MQFYPLLSVKIVTNIRSAPWAHNDFLDGELTANKTYTVLQYVCALNFIGGQFLSRGAIIGAATLFSGHTTMEWTTKVARCTFKAKYDNSMNGWILLEIDCAD